MTYWRQPVGKDEGLDWTPFLRHSVSFTGEQKIRDIYEEMLTQKIDFAVEVNEQKEPLGLISFKMLAAALSGEYGQALFSKKMLKDARLFRRRLAPSDKKNADLVLKLVILLPEVAVIETTMDLMGAQSRIESRPIPHSFDDIILVGPDHQYQGLIAMRDFMKLQMNLLHWHQRELSQRNKELSQTLQELSLTQAELVNRNKMASLGELIAGIAHELNTPIGVLSSSHQVLEKFFLKTKNETDQTESKLELLQQTFCMGQEAVARVSQIIESLKTFGTKDKEEFQSVHLCKTVESCLVLMSHKLTGEVKLEVEMPSELEILCHPGQISQVLMNILTNAWQALPPQGKISIKIIANKRMVEIQIRDNGPGIPPHLLERVFDPGFTTKGVGVGTGLGLSICRKIVELNHGGRLEVFNHEEGGAMIKILLPRL